MVEKHVNIVKNLFSKALCDGQDPLLVLLEWRNSPRDPILGSPVQRLMGRRTRTRLPVSQNLLAPKVIPPVQVSSRLRHYRLQSKTHYDQHAKNLPVIQPNDTIRIRDGSKWVPARFVSRQQTPRSYNVETPSGRIVSRNRRHLLVTNESNIFNRAQTQFDLENSDVQLGLGETVQQRVVQVRSPISQTNVQNQASQSVKPTQSNQNASVVPAVVKTPVTTRSGRVSQAPTRYNDFVKP